METAVEIPETMEAFETMNIRVVTCDMLLEREERDAQSLQGMSLQFHFQFKNALISKGIISNRQAERTESSFHTQDFPQDLD